MDCGHSSEQYLRVASGSDLARPFVLVCGLALILVGFGWLRHPHIAAVSVCAALLSVTLYSLAALLAFARLLPPRSHAVKFAWWGGLAAALVFCGEICLEYVLLPPDNTRFGLVEFGTVWLTYLIVAAAVAAAGGRLRDSVNASVVAAMISSILWCVVLLAVFYAFEGTARQTSVLLAEGDFEDFRRSGMASFPDFEMEDLFGATFFHLLLGPLVAALIACAGWVGIRALRLLKNSGAS